MREIIRGVTTTFERENHVTFLRHMIQLFGTVSHVHNPKSTKDKPVSGELCTPCHMCDVKGVHLLCHNSVLNTLGNIYLV